MDRIFQKTLFEILNTKSTKCLFTGNNCDKKPIKAHSIQNAKVFELLNREGHVVGVKPRLDNSLSQTIAFTNIGRKNASVFEGLCKVHDFELFKTIDHKDLDTNNLEQLFKMSVR